MDKKPVVIVAFDQLIFASDIIRTLEEKGFEVLGCRNADEVMGGLRNHNVSVLVIEQMLAHSETLSPTATNSGLETGPAIGELMRNLGNMRPILFITTHADKKLGERISKISGRNKHLDLVDDAQGELFRLAVLREVQSLLSTRYDDPYTCAP